MDGWELEEFDELNNVMNDIYGANYEIKSCVRGCYTSCTTYADLADYLDELSERLSGAASYLRTKSEPDNDEEEE